jgi:hypothetical protein
MIEHIRKILTGQFEAALCMLHDCVRKCPPEHWDAQIARFTFWHVAYHTLCFVDLYLSPSDTSFEPRAIHPLGLRELIAEFPSRRFTPEEITAYVAICRQKAVETLAAETPASLQGPSGFPRLPFSRAELHLYNIRHIQHHTGQLSAFLRRLDIHADWVSTGWR